MEYSPSAKINKSLKEKKALIDAPPIKARSLYAQEYAKKAKTIHQSKDAMEHAYGAVEKKHGKEARDSLKAYHDANYNDNDGLKRGGSAKKKHTNW
jgi:hypothetical protein